VVTRETNNQCQRGRKAWRRNPVAVFGKDGMSTVASRTRITQKRMERKQMAERKGEAGSHEEGGNWKPVAGEGTQG